MPKFFIVSLILSSAISAPSYAAKGIPSDLIENQKSTVCRLLTQVRERDEAGNLAWKSKGLCSATLIDGDDTEGNILQSRESRYFLSAGHCDPRLGDSFKGKETQVIAQCPGGFEAKVSEMLVHEAYLRRSAFSTHDFSVGRLEQALPIQPARLTSQISLLYVQNHFHRCAVAGYGENNEGKIGQLSVVALNPATMVMSRDYLSFQMLLNSRIGEIVPGDSGGPVLCRESENDQLSVFAVNSYRFANSMGVSNSVAPHISWIRARLGNWERVRLGTAPLEDLANHEAHQERIQLCAQEVMASHQPVEEGFSLIGRKILSDCAYQMQRARDSGFTNVDFLRSIMNGIYRGDLVTAQKRRLQGPIAVPNEWESFEKELQVVLRRSGF